ncbi:hypothetical protein [Kluyvera chengduensis]
MKNSPGFIIENIFPVAHGLSCQYKENPKKSYGIDLNLILKIIF